jgi:hypothetical protein
VITGAALVLNALTRIHEDTGSNLHSSSARFHCPLIIGSLA